MALADITPKLNIDIDLTQTTPRFTFQDATDYTGQSVTLADVEGNIKLVVNGSATPTYDNLNDWADSDIVGSSSGQSNEDLTRFRTQASYIPAPLVNGELVEGTYAFTYQVSDDNGTTTVVSTITYTLAYNKVTGDLDYSINLNPTAPQIKIEDKTNYVVDGVTPTISGTLTLFYPPNSTLGGSTSTPITAVSGSLTATRFNTGTQSAKLDVDLTYDLSSKATTAASATGTSNAPVFTLEVLDELIVLENDIDVESVSSICDLYCCVKSFTDKLRTAGSTSERQRLRQITGEVAIYIGQISNAYSCGKGEDINTYVEQVKDLVGCDDDCGCTSGDAPVVIEALSPAGIPSQNVLHYTGLSSPSTYTEPLLIGSTYETTGTQRRQDFSVFIGSAGQLDQLTAFDSTTGQMTFSGSVTTTFTVVRYR